MQNISCVTLGQLVLSRTKEAPVRDDRKDAAYWASGVEELMAAKGEPRRRYIKLTKSWRQTVNMS